MLFIMCHHAFFVFCFVVVVVTKTEGSPYSFEGELIGEAPVGRSANIQELLCLTPGSIELTCLL